MLSVSACSASSSSTTTPSGQATRSAATATLSDLALQLAAADGMPPRRSVYLRPLQRLAHRCAPGSVDAVGTAVETLAVGLAAQRLVPAPRAASEAALAASLRRTHDCYASAKLIIRELARRSAPPAQVWRGQTLQLRYSPALTAELVLASVRHSLLNGKVRVVYSLHTAQCQQVIYMGWRLAAQIGSSYYGAFVELSSGRGVGKSRYRADQVDRARVSLLGAIGGQPCSS